MDFAIWRPWPALAFLKPNDWEYALFVLGVILSLALVYRYRRSFTGLSRRQGLLLAACLLSPVILERLLVVEFTARHTLPPPGIPFIPPRPAASLLSLVPIAVAGAWLGAGPGLLVGLISGILRSGATMGRIGDPYHLAAFGLFTGLLLHQDYCGRLPAIARQPAITLPLMTPVAAFLLLGSSFAPVAEAGLSGLDYAIGWTYAHLVPFLVEGLVAGAVVQTVYLLKPRWRPIRAPHRSPPYSHKLNRRLLLLFGPLIGLMTVVLVYAVTAAALRLATSHALQRMARDAVHAANEIPYFIQTGQGLISEYARDPDLLGRDAVAMESCLRRNMQTVVFFDQLLLFQADGQLLATYPPLPTGDPLMTPQEFILVERGLESGATQISSVHRSERGLVIQSFLTPVLPLTSPSELGAPSRVLIGRTQLDVNPIIERVLTGIQWPEAGSEGFLVDAEARIVAHPNANRLLTEHRSDEGPRLVPAPMGGLAYESRNPRDNTRELVYQLPVEGHPWAVVIRLPYTVVSEQATQIAAPLLGLQIVLGGALVIVISLVISWVTQPLQQLASAADRIAEGDLSGPVDIPGHDEVARVGHAFEHMRLGLKHHMDELSLLLEVSQTVSATLEVAQGMPLILDGVLRATGAQVARAVLLSPDANPGLTLSRGEPFEGLHVLDEALSAAACNRTRPLVLENLARAKSWIDPDPLPPSVKTVVALPIRTRRQGAGVLWIGYAAPRRIDGSQIDLLSTLAGQAAVLVENARLFRTAEGERRRLGATLASTTEAVIVTDREKRVLLINPAAERAFSVEADQVSGRRIDQCPLPRLLMEAFSAPLHPPEGLNRELPLPQGRTLCVNVSAILSGDGQRLGRVAVMRDITQLKELNQLKSDFVATVSHDLRGPLSFIRGYATMLSTVGDLNQQQQEYVENILRGLARMRDLVENLLDLGRIEAGVGLEREPCHLGVILAETVETMRARAAAKGVTLRLESLSPLPAASDQAAVVRGDATLLLRAMTNLVDNAIKYTPSRGVVTVGLSVRGRDPTKRAVIRVSDTGIGIAPRDQPHLFEKFYRPKRSDAPDVPGTGLGLSLVKSIVHRHDGEVSVESKPNQGSTFCITLPLTTPSPGDG